MSKKNKNNIIQIKSMKSKYYYTKYKSKNCSSNINKKIIKIKKYDPNLKIHVWFSEKIDYT